jgi:very-short-patch-repair endonuclease
MATTDESENLPNRLSERINCNGWRVIRNPTRQPDAEADELKTLIQTMQQHRRTPAKRKLVGIDPPEAA